MKDERLRQAKLYLERHHASVEPDAGFADRVLARIDRDPAGMLGRAALRLLPASLLLALVLAWAAVRTEAWRDTTAGQASDEDVIAWILQSGETSP